MTHDEALALLPSYTAGELDVAGELEVHLAGCASCSSELARYRELTYSLRALRSRVQEPTPALQERILAMIPPRRVRDDVRRIVREHPQAVSLGTAALGAAAIGLLWWRAARRRVAAEAEPAVVSVG